MTVRTVRDQDWPTVVELVHDLHAGDSGKSPGSLRRNIRQDARQFVATDSDTVVGYALVTLTDDGVEPYGMLEHLVVDDARRGQGYGHELVDAAVTWLRSERAVVVFTSTVGAREVAFYESCGFKACTGPWLARPIGGN